MFLMHNKTGNLVRVEDLEELFNPMKHSVLGRDQAGEEEQEPAWFAKSELMFPSGEPMPACWTNPAYRQLPSGAAADRPKATAID